MNELGGYRNDIAVALTGLDIEAKAQLVEDAFWEACPYEPDDFASVTHAGGPHRQGRPRQQRGGGRGSGGSRVKDPDERKVGPRRVQRHGRARPGHHPRLLRPVRRAPARPGRTASTGRRWCPPSSCPSTSWCSARRTHRGRVRGTPATPATVGVDAAPGPAATAPGGATVRGAARAVSSAPARATRAATPTSASSPAPTRPGPGSTGSSPSTGSGSCCPRPPTSTSTATGWPTSASLNFVIHGLLQEGVAASTRQDGQAKSLGEWLRARVVELPAALLADGP